MSEKSVQRNRGANWTANEKKALVDLITPYCGIIENTKRDAVSLLKRKEIWQRIRKKFNERYPSSKTLQQIKRQWQLLKFNARSERSNYQRKALENPRTAERHRPSFISTEIHRLQESLRRIDLEEAGPAQADVQIVGLEKIVETIVAIEAVEAAEAAEAVEEADAAEDAEAEDAVEAAEAAEAVEAEETAKAAEAVEAEETAEDIRINRRREIEIIFREAEINIRATETPQRNIDEVVPGEADETTSQDIVHDTKLVSRYLLGSKIFQSVTMQRAVLTISRNMASLSQIRMAGERGSGAGKGGGGGGTIREAGGSFGKMEAAHEDQYFYNMDKDKMQKLKDGLHDEISFHEEQIKRHEEAINRHKKRITEMNKE